MIAVVDYATGNLRSVADALRRAGAEFTLTADPAPVSYTHLTLPTILLV